MPPPAVDSPDPAAVDWAARNGWRPERWEPLAGDLSARSYFRLRRREGDTCLLALYPGRLAEECGRFLESASLLRRAGVPGPAILASDCGRGRMLVEDLGPLTLAELAPEPSARLPYFRRAAQLIERIAALPRVPVATLNPPLDADLLARELERTRRAFLEPRGLLGAAEAVWERAAARLCRRLGESPPVPCHRDMMVRNLVPCGEPPGLAVIDHQGLRLGPASYDLASLLNDTLFLPRADEERLLAETVPSGERLVYHRAAAQRTLKAVGTYADFARRGVERHVSLIAPTFRRALDHLARCPEAEELAERLAANRDRSLLD